MLRGTIYLTNNPNIIYQADLRTTKIINMDEDGILQENKNILGGTCLLPPIEAKIAEADGNEQLYDMSYHNHLLEPYQQFFIAAIIAALYKGANLLIFFDEIGYTNTTKKFVEQMYIIYGIHIGIIGEQDPALANCYYDNKCIPIWLNLIYSAKIIDGYEFCIQYPPDAELTNPQVIEDLIEEMNPVGNTIQEKFHELDRYRKHLHLNPNVIMPISSTI